MARELIDTDEAAAMLGVSSHTLENWRYLGTGPRYFRVGRRIKYAVGDIEAYLDGCVQDADSRPAA